jgi:hypothetical protein
MTDENALPPRNHNNPPEPTPFDLSKDEIEGLFGEAKNWLDGSGVNSAADAEGVSRLLDMIRKATATADERRKVEAKPFDDGKAEVQTRYGLLIGDTKSVKGKAVLAAECCKRALTPWLDKVEADKRAVAEAARKEADAKAAAAQEALRTSSHDDLLAREAAEEQLREAGKAEAAAKRAEKDKAHAKGGTRAVSLRSTFRPEITDATAFARWLWSDHKQELIGHLMTIAERHVANGARTLPGVTVHEDRGAV